MQQIKSSTRGLGFPCALLFWHSAPHHPLLICWLLQWNEAEQSGVESRVVWSGCVMWLWLVLSSACACRCRYERMDLRWGKERNTSTHADERVHPRVYTVFCQLYGINFDWYHKAIQTFLPSLNVCVCVLFCSKTSSKAKVSTEQTDHTNIHEMILSKFMQSLSFSYTACICHSPKPN